jgi:predicted MFS family arabinose efflux permease
VRLTLRVPDRRTLVVGLGITLGNTAQSAIPWIVGGLTDSEHLDLHQASLMVTSEVSAMGVTMLIASTVVHKMPRKLVFFVAAALAIAAQIASVGVKDPALLAMVRAASGVGFGLIYSIASAIGAGARAPARTYATAGTIALLLGVLIHPMLGYGLQHYGAEGVFGGIVILASVLSIPLLVLRFDRAEAAPTESAAVSGASETRWNGSTMLAAAGVVLTMALMSAAVSGLYVLLERIAKSVGLGGTALGAGMSVVSLLGASGGVWANLLSKKFGNARPLLIGLPLIGALLLGMTVVAAKFEFWAAFVGITIMFWFLYPFIFGLAAAVDPKGRVASATGSGKILLASGGTALAGYLGGTWGAAAYGVAALTICTLAMLVAAGVLRLLKTHRGAARAEAQQALAT